MADDYIKNCPRCEVRFYVEYAAPTEVALAAMRRGYMPPALSRADNETYVCSECGMEEAMQDFIGGGATPVTDWPVHVESPIPSGPLTPTIRIPEVGTIYYGRVDEVHWGWLVNDGDSVYDAHGTLPDAMRQVFSWK